MVDRALQQSRANFANAFQQRIAPITGRTYTPARNYAAPSKSVSDAVLERITLIDQYRHPKKSTTSSSSSSSSSKKKKTAKKETTNVLKLLSEAPSAKSFKEMSKAEQNAYLASVPPAEATAAIESMFDQDGWRGFISDKLGGAAEGAVNVALEAISRPGYALFSGLTDSAKAMNEGEQPWEVADEIASGVVGGLTGSKRSGAGDVLNQMTLPSDQTDRTKWGDIALSGTGNNPIRGLQGTRAVAERDPDMNFVQGYNKTMLRAGGATGEVFFDPTNVVSGGAAAVAASTGKQVAKEVVISSIDDIVKKATRETLTATGKNPSRVKNVTRAVGARAAESVDTIATPIRGGAQRGSIKFGGRTFAPTVAAHATDEVSRQLLAPFEKALANFHAGKLSTPARLNAALQNPEFKIFYDDLVDSLSNNVVHDVAVKQAELAARSSVDNVVNELNAKVFEGVRGAFYNAPGVRVAGKTIPFNRIGKAYNAQVTNKPWDAIRDLSHAAQNPGRLANLNNMARSLGLRRFSAEAKEITKVARAFSKSEREELSRALFTNVVPSDPKMEQAWKFLKNKYDQILVDEVDTGVRSARQKAADNYQYLWMKGSDREVAEFKKLRKEAVAQTGSLQHGIDEAIAAGVRPERDAFKNLQYRMAKSQRDMTRSYFNTQLLDDYGFQGKRLTKEQARARNLVEVKGGFKPGATTLPVKKSKIPVGEAWYLPKEINEVLENFKKMSSMSAANAETRRVLKVYDWFLNKFKYAVTVMYPGFHVRNSIGDIFMGLLDGVGLQDYKVVAQMFEDRFPEIFGKVGVTPKFSKINIGGNSYNFDELWEMYQTHAASGGFFHADNVGETVIGGGGNPVTKLGSKVNQGIRKGSEGREDLMRFAHYVKALKTEVAGGSHMEDAIQAAALRVNGYHFDYGALTPLEKNGVKRVVPFYTFMRKAIPKLVESMFMSPKWLAVLNRAQSKVHDDEFFSPLRIPEWQMQAGTTNLTPGEEEPWMMDSGLFPTGSLDVLNQTTAQGLAQQLVGQTAPMVKAPFEIATGRSTFNAAPALTQGGQVPGTDIGTSKMAEYLLNTFVPPARSAKNLTGGEYGSFNEFLIGDRMGLGLGIRKLKANVQNTTLRHNMQTLSDEVSANLNPSLEKIGMKVYFSNRKDGASFRVKDTTTNDIVFDGTLEELIPMVEKISKQQQGE